MNHLCLFFLTFAFCVGCSTPVKYEGDGDIKDTSYWDYGKHTRYSIQLASFGLDTNFSGTYDLGNISFFKETRMSVSLCFVAEDMWWESKSSISSTNPYIDTLKSRLTYEIASESGAILFSSDLPLSKYTWGQMAKKGRPTFVEIYNLKGGSLTVPKNEKLKLNMAYLGDPSITNRAELIVYCRKK